MELMSSNIQRAPGQQNPTKYPFVGPNYQRLGEQPGFVYHPWSDKYYPDPKAQEELARSQGLTKKDPSLTDAILPIAAVAGGTALATEGGKAIPGLIKDGISGAKGLFGLGSGATTSSVAATGTSSGSALGGLAAPEIVAAERVGEAGALAPSGGLFGIGALPAAGIVAGTYLGGKSLYDMIRGKKDNSIPGKIGRATLGVATGGISEVARHFIKDGDQWKKEKRGLLGLQGEGTYIPQNLIDEMPSKGRSKEELLQIEKDNIAKGGWGNTDFAESRNESSLKPMDIVNYSAFAKNDPEWFRKPLDQRLQLAQKALDAGAVREHHGTIDIDWSKVNPAPPPAQQPVQGKGLFGMR
jgi:hypothetical protein